MSEDLLRRVRLEYAALLVDRVDPGRAVMLACHLLVAGINGDAVVALAIESPTGLLQSRAERLVEKVVRDLDIAKPDLPQAVALVAADVCARMLDGTLPVERGGHQLLVVGHDGSDLCDVLDAILPLVDRLEWSWAGWLMGRYGRSCLTWPETW